MITIFNVHKNTTPLTAQQNTVLWQCIDAYAKTVDGAWLKDLNWESFKYLWKADLEGSMNCPPWRWRKCRERRNTMIFAPGK